MQLLKQHVRCYRKSLLYRAVQDPLPPAGTNRLFCNTYKVEEHSNEGIAGIANGVLQDEATKIFRRLNWPGVAGRRLQSCIRDAQVATMFLQKLVYTIAISPAVWLAVASLLSA